MTQYVPFNINRNVTFYCEVIGTDLIWEYRRLQLLHLLRSINVFAEDGIGSGQEIGSGQSGNITRNSTLLVTVNESDIERGLVRNNSEIRCFPPEMAGDIEPVFLRTYGWSLCFHYHH